MIVINKKPISYFFHSCVSYLVLFLFVSCNSAEEIRITRFIPLTINLSLNPLTIINSSNVASYSFSGACSDDGLNIDYDIDSGAITGSALCSSGSWSVTGLDVSAASDGLAVNFTIDYTDASGDSFQEVATILKDTILPTEPTLVTTANGTTVFSQTLTMTGVCENDSLVEISGAGISSTLTQTCASNAYSLKTTLTAGVGSKTFFINATDAAGNVSTTLSGSYTLAEPFITFDSNTQIEASYTVATASLSIGSCTGINEVLLTEATSTPTSGDANWAACSTGAGDYTFTIGDTNQGNHSIYVWLKDTSGDINLSSTQLNFIYDTVPPVITSFILEGGALNIALPSISFDLIATDTSSAIVEMRLSESSVYADDSWVAYAPSSTVNVSAVSGTKTVYIWIKDAAGNISISSANDDIELEYGDPPKVSVDQPDGTVDFIASDSVSIEWSCSAGTGTLASPAVPTIDYTTDEGLTFNSITTNQINNLTSTTGSYTWTLPGALTGTPFRIRVRCATTAGVVSSSYSQMINTSGWKIFIGDPWAALTDINATVADVSSVSRSSATGDNDFNTYYVKDSAIMKIDSSTGLVTRFAGELHSSGCTMATGVNPLAGFTFDTPVILGKDQTKENMYVMSKNCNKIFKIKFSDSSVTEWASFTTSSLAHFYLTKNQTFIYVSSNNLYTVDFNIMGSSNVLIHGNGVCGPLSRTFPANGTNALTVSLDLETECNNLLLFANDDASSIWLDGQGLDNGYRLDNAGANYIIGETDLGINKSDNQHCLPSPNSDKVFCVNRHTGRTIHTYNLITNLWEADNEIPFEQNDSSGFLSLGDYPDRLVAIYSLNEIQSIDISNWEFTTIAGQPLSIFGNGDPPNLVALHIPVDVKYNSNTNYVWIRSRSGHVRRVDLGVSPYQTDTALSLSGHLEERFFSINPAGDKMLNLTSCARSYLLGFSVSGLMITNDTDFILGPCHNSTGTYPPVSGTSATDGSAFFGGGYMEWFSVPVYHSNGNSYFSPNTFSNDIFIFSSNGITIDRVAGVAGVGGYSAADNGNAALGASLTNVRQMQEILSGPNAGDLLVWDNDRLRLITITSESGSPNIYDILDLNLAAGFTNEIITDFYYDESTEQAGGLGTGVIYYSTISNKVFKYQTDATMTSATTTEYDFTGTTLENYIRITKIPGSLLVLQPNKKRILSVPE